MGFKNPNLSKKLEEKRMSLKSYTETNKNNLLCSTKRL